MLKYWLVAASLTALCEASAARAQTNTGASAPQSVGTAAPAPSTSESGGVEEIVVTATRRAVDLQRVPATVEALPAATLASLDISNLLQLPDLVPGLYVTPAGGNNLYLRGVGTPSTGFNEAQVAIYLDGVYLANPALSVFSFNNIDQIEVLKGASRHALRAKRHCGIDFDHNPQSRRVPASGRVGQLRELRHVDRKSLRLNADHQHLVRQCLDL